MALKRSIFFLFLSIFWIKTHTILFVPWRDNPWLLTEVLHLQTKNIVSHGFESCYDWRPVLELVLGAAANEFRGLQEVKELLNILLLLNMLLELLLLGRGESRG